MTLKYKKADTGNGMVSAFYLIVVESSNLYLGTFEAFAIWLFHDSALALIGDNVISGYDS